jgi:hypothetical protein
METVQATETKYLLSSPLEKKFAHPRLEHGLCAQKSQDQSQLYSIATSDKWLGLAALCLSFHVCSMGALLASQGRIT